MKRFRIEFVVFSLLITPLLKEKYNNFSRWEILKMKRAFEDYLIAFNNKKLLDIPMDPLTVFTNMSHPLKSRGFNPETILHFIEFSKTYQI
jgi:hypothetical protein